MNIPIGIFLYLPVMTGKAERTTQYIIETVAPVFNRNGYEGTSMSDLTKATGLTKGAIYGNFENKEVLALAAFRHNAEFVFRKLSTVVAQEESRLDKLRAIVRFYRTYHRTIPSLGGCPLLNVGVDASNLNGPIASEVRKMVKKVTEDMAKIIGSGIKRGEINPVKPDSYANIFYSTIQGSVYMMSILDDPVYLQDGMDALDQIIERELRP